MACTSSSCCSATAVRIAPRSIRAASARRRPLDLVDDDQPLLAVRLDGEGRAAAGRSAGWLLLDGPLDVLRVEVAAADDDQVLEPAGDEQLAVVEEAEVAGAQERPLAGVRPGGAAKVCSVASGAFQ